MLVKTALVVEVTGKPEKIDALIELLKSYGIKELPRTGITSFLRGNNHNHLK